jgi:archaeal flagellin N-terminal-like domain
MVGPLLRKRGLSSAIAILILIVIIVSLVVPFLFYLQYMRQNTQITGAIINNYLTLKQLQYKSVISGHPAIYYLGGTQKGQ